MLPEKKTKASLTDWLLKLRTSTSQEEGAIRDFSVMTTGIKGEGGHVTAITCTKVDETMQAIAGSEFELKADLICWPGVHTSAEGMLDELSLERDAGMCLTRPLPNI